VRLRNRGREAPEDVSARLARDIPHPQGLTVFTIVNDGTVAQGVAAFTDFLLTVTVEADTPTL
jgi:ribose 1,5-bisphosphokinase PhnN